MAPNNKALLVVLLIALFSLAILSGANIFIRQQQILGTKTKYLAEAPTPTIIKPTPTPCTPGNVICCDRSHYKKCLPPNTWSECYQCPNGGSCSGNGVCFSPPTPTPPPSGFIPCSQIQLLVARYCSSSTPTPIPPTRPPTPTPTRSPAPSPHS